MTHTRFIPRLRMLLPLATLALLACDDGSSWLDETAVQASAPPLALQEGLIYTPASAPSGADVVTIDLSVDPPRAQPRKLTTPVAARARRAGVSGDAVLLTAGAEAHDEGKRRVPMQPSQLVVVTRGGEQVARSLSGRYGSLALSEDGRFALAHTPTGNLVLQNAIEVVDLEAPAAQPGKVVNLELDGRSPSGFVFSPKGAFSRRLAVILFAGSVMLLDLEHPEHGAIAVPLTASADPRAQAPQRVLFAGERLFVQTGGQSSLLALGLIAAPDQRHGFRVVPSLLTASAALRDVALIGSGDGLRIAAVTGQVELLDPQTGSTSAVASAANATRIVPFEGRSPADATAAPRGLLYAPGATSVGFVELGGGDGWTGRNVETVELGEALSGVVPLGQRKLALGLHANNRLSVIDLEARTVDPYRLSVGAFDWLLDEDAAHARVWVLSGATLGVIDLLAKTTSEVPVTLSGFSGALSGRDPRNAGASASTMAIVPGPRPRLALVHPSEAGRVLLLDADAPTRESARELAGFFLAGLFDRGAP